MNEGRGVAGIDGLKIEPLAARFSGIDVGGSRVPVEPIREVQNLYEGLDDRVMAGFGGGAGHGSTGRWGKKFLAGGGRPPPRPRPGALVGGRARVRTGSRLGTGR